MYFGPGSWTDLGPVACSNSCEDFLLEFTKKFGTTVLTRNTPFACVARFAIAE
jgi:hypothetical protein